MAICKNSACFQSYQSTDGIVVARLVRLLRANHDTAAAPTPENIQRLRKLAPRIYQSGAVCAGCGLEMANVPGPTEPPEVNYLLENIEVLGTYGIVV
jgi:hypothetical protein